MLTEFILAFVAGDEKRASPVPTRINPKIIMYNGVFSFKKMNNESPMVVIAIPMDVIVRVSTLSDILPAKGDRTATDRGSKTSIIPASFGLNNLIYWS